jgi:hypothetical protein
MPIRKMLPPISLLFLAFFSATPELSAGRPGGQSAVPSTKTPVSIPETALSIKVDGILDDEAWKSARVFELRYEVAPGENVAPQVRTECLLISNANYLLAAFRCFDPQPRLIRAHYSDRDQIMNDDRVVLALDTFNDERRNFEFAGNPLGIQGDWIRLNNHLDANWDAIWDCAGRIEEWGYSVEFAIPFDQLRFRKTDGPQIWGFTAYRLLARNVEYTIGLVPDDRNNNCTQCQMIKIQGFEAAVPGKAVELTPTVTAARTDIRPDWPSGGFRAQTKEADLGLTAKWGLTPNLTLQGTINPDFSQVEADALQMNINQPFALFYQEKRPFFTESADYFEALSNVRIEGLQYPVYSRAIRDPRWGLKLTGKEGGHTFGFYSLQDGITNLVFPGPERSFSASLSAVNQSSVFRYRRDLGSQYSIGALVTDREGSEYFNRVLGFDADFRLGDKDRIIAQAMGSSTRYPGSTAETFGQPQEPFSDAMWLLHYAHDARNYRFFADYQDFGNGFRADLGYIPKVGYTKAEAGGGLTWWGDDTGFLNRAVMDASIRQTRKTDGSLMLRTFEIMGSLHGPANSAVYFYYGARDRNYEGLRLYQDFKGFGFDTRPSGSFNLGGFCAWEDKIDYDRGRPAAEFFFTPQIVFSPNRHLNLNLNYTYLTLDVDGGRLFRVNALDTAFIYQFTSKIFFRAILQYMDVLRNPGLYDSAVEEQSKSLFTQMLFSYKVNPRTVLFLGYSDNAQNDPSFRLLRTDRTFFVKIGYAWTL